MSPLKVLSHPVVAERVGQLRDVRTGQADFVRLVDEITRFVAYEALGDAPTIPTSVDTPVVAAAPALTLKGRYVLVPVLRAGLGMIPAVQELVTHHRVCLVGLRRNEVTLAPEVYLDGLPDSLSGDPVVICDPMLATGGSMVRVIEMLRDREAGSITALSLIAARPGVESVLARYPEVLVVTAALDEALNDVGYITPGLGDAGDRLFGPPAR